MKIECLFCSGQRYSEEDQGYSLNIGNAIDVFANYGNLSQVFKVISADNEDAIVPFRENIRVFSNVTSKETKGDADGIINMELLLCETFEDLLEAYFKNFHIQGTDKPWKVFMGDCIHDKIMRTFGIEYDPTPDRYLVLAKLIKVHKTVDLGNLDGVAVKDYVLRAIEDLNVTDTADVRNFMKSYGTHYIDSYATGNIIYQVFEYQRHESEMLRSNFSMRNAIHAGTANHRSCFFSHFLKQVGDIRIASGNKTIETWARMNLRDGQYLHSRPSLLRLYYNADLVSELDSLMDKGAIIGLNLKTLKPIFKDSRKGQIFAEVVENDLLLWEVNA